jgi:hypothetical protein
MRVATYTEISKEIQTGDCVMWRSHRLLGRAIRIWSPGYNHASLVLRLPEYEGRLRRYQLEALEHGIVLTLLSRSIEEYDGEVFWLPLREIPDQTRRRIGEWAVAQVGTPYDYESLFAQMFGRVSVDARRFFCSEFVFLAYRHVEIVPDGRAPKPSDIPALGVFGEMVEITRE